jgi:hypothetical protein
MFLHNENQQLLWQTLQKTPYLIEFSQKFAGYREEWFKGTIEQFYTQWISRNNRVPTNAKELLEINKYALQVMVADLKRLLGYSSSHRINNAMDTTQKIEVSGSVPIPTYDINSERKQRGEQWSSNFNKYQTEYNQMLKTADIPMRGLPSETGGEKIKNMDELLREHAKMRDMDLSIYSPPSTSKNMIQPENQIPKLKILDEIERIEMNVDETDPIIKKTVRFEMENYSTTSNEISSNYQ